MSEERLQKILSRAGVTSRRKAEELIRDGRVTINGRVGAVGDKADLGQDVVKLDGKRIAVSPHRRYLLLNKPRGFLTARTDASERPTVFDLVPEGMRRGLMAVGRLDFQTEGLLLLTDDGDFAQLVAHPRFGCTKTYTAKVKGLPGEEQLEKLRRGIVLDGRLTAPARFSRLRLPRRGGRPAENSSWWRVEIGEGRTRQIREMFFRVGHPVQKLRRVAIGPLSDRVLPLGRLRPLTEQEVEMLRRSSSATGGGEGRRPGKGAGRPGRGPAPRGKGR